MTNDQINEAVARTKTCTGCNQSYPINGFNKNKRSPDGFDWKCKKCQRAWSLKWTHSEKGRLYSSLYRKKNYSLHKEYKKANRLKQALKFPEKIRARWLVGNAIRHKFMSPPIIDRNWCNGYEFHHPDHNRPYYGCWVLKTEHRKMERGDMEFPPFTDFSDIVRNGVLKEWGLL